MKIINSIRGVVPIIHPPPQPPTPIPLETCCWISSKLYAVNHGQAPGSDLFVSVSWNSWHMIIYKVILSSLIEGKVFNFHFLLTFTSDSSVKEFCAFSWEILSKAIHAVSNLCRTTDASFNHSFVLRNNATTIRGFFFIFCFILIGKKRKTLRFLTRSGLHWQQRACSTVKHVSVDVTQK